MSRTSAANARRALLAAVIAGVRQRQIEDAVQRLVNKMSPVEEAQLRAALDAGVFDPPGSRPTAPTDAPRRNATWHW